MQRRAMAMAAAMMAAALAGDGVAEAQTVGSFRWQQQPYCNVIQLTVVQQGSLYRVDGFDDQCGAPNSAGGGHRPGAAESERFDWLRPDRRDRAQRGASSHLRVDRLPSTLRHLEQRQ